MERKFEERAFGRKPAERGSGDGLTIPVVEALGLLEDEGALRERKRERKRERERERERERG